MYPASDKSQIKPKKSPKISINLNLCFQCNHNYFNPILCFIIITYFNPILPQIDATIYIILKLIMLNYAFAIMLGFNSYRKSFYNIN